MRLYEALLAGTRTGYRGAEWSEGKANAFRWLAQCQPPLIVSPVAQAASTYTFFGPNNDSDKPEEQERKGKLARPHRLRDGETVYYIWRIEETGWLAAHHLAEILCREARHLLALGWGIDQVVGNGRVMTDAEVGALKGRRWRAWSARWPGSRTWRVPCADSLEDLERVHETFLQRVRGNQYFPQLRFSKFETVTYISDNAMPVRFYAAFELPEGVAFRGVNAAKVAAMLRSLASRCAKADTHQFPGGSGTYVAGHIGKEQRTPPRFSYLPLPTIGHEHADGMVRRLIIAEPFGGDGVHARWAQNRMRNAALRDEHGNERGVLLDLWRRASKPMIERYVNEATRMVYRYAGDPSRFRRRQTFQGRENLPHRRSTGRFSCQCHHRPHNA